MTQSAVAFIDGSLFSLKSGVIEKHNIILKNGIWVGTGYIPDDEDQCQVQNIRHCIIVPSAIERLDLKAYFTSLAPQFSASKGTIPSALFIELFKIAKLELGWTDEAFFTHIQQVYQAQFPGQFPKWGLLSKPSFWVIYVGPPKEDGVVPEFKFLVSNGCLS